MSTAGLPFLWIISQLLPPDNKGKAEVCAQGISPLGDRFNLTFIRAKFLNPGGSVKDRVALRGKYQ